MKTAMIARFVLGAGAIFAVAGLAGCGAGEQGSGESGAIGSTSEALSVTSSSPTPFDSITAAGANPRVSQPREGAASCTIHDSTGSKDYLLVMGGLDNAGTPVAQNTWYLFDPSGAKNSTPSTEWVLSGTFTTGRHQASAIQKPNDSTVCYLVGGLDASNTAITTNKTVRFTLTNSGGLSMAVNSSVATTDVTPRAKVALAPCGASGRIIAFGGVSAGNTPLAGFSNTPSEPTIEIFDGTSWHVATNGGAGHELDFSSPRLDFGFTKDPSGDNYLVAGGKLASGRTDTLEMIKVASSCNYDSVTLPAVSAVLSKGVEGNVLIPEGNTNKWLSAAGYETTNGLRTTTDVLTVNWGTPNSTTKATGGPALPTGGTHNPKLVNVASLYYVLVGGDDFSGGALGSSIARVQQFTPGAGATGTWATAATLTDSRYFNVAEYLPSQTSGGNYRTYTAAGVKTGTGKIATVEEIVSP